MLPRYTGSGSWMYLIKDTYAFITTQGAQTDNRINNILHKFPFSLPYSGSVARESGANVNQDTHGYFWSAGTNSATTARYLLFYGVSVWPEYNAYKTDGFTVRCVAQCLFPRTPKPLYLELVILA